MNMYILNEETVTFVLLKQANCIQSLHFKIFLFVINSLICIL